MSRSFSQPFARLFARRSGRRSGRSFRRSFSRRLSQRFSKAFLLTGLILLSRCATAPEPPPEKVREPDKDPGQIEQPQALPTPLGTLSFFPEAPLPRLYPARWYRDSPAACSLTFDDGTLDQFLLAAPELDARGLTGTFFVITGFREDGLWIDSGTPRRLFSWDQGRNLAWRGHELANHTVNHLDLSKNGGEAEFEIAGGLRELQKEIPWVSGYSLGWPYWRSSPEAEEAASRYHRAGRSGTIRTGQGAINPPNPENIMAVRSFGVLSRHSADDLLPLLEETYAASGWLVPNFHGIDNGFLPREALGWEAVSLGFFRDILDTLAGTELWIAPFGEVSRYIERRDSLQLFPAEAGAEAGAGAGAETAAGAKAAGAEAAGAEASEAVAAKAGAEAEAGTLAAAWIDGSGLNLPLTLILELPLSCRLTSVRTDGPRHMLPFTLQGSNEETARYLIELPGGSGTLIMTVDMRQEK